MRVRNGYTVTRSDFRHRYVRRAHRTPRVIDISAATGVPFFYLFFDYYRVHIIEHRHTRTYVYKYYSVGRERRPVLIKKNKYKNNKAQR